MTSEKEIAQALAKALRVRDETPIQPASPASTYVALCYDDPVVQDNASLLNLVAKDNFKFPLSNSFVDGLLHCCSRIESSSSKSENNFVEGSLYATSSQSCSSGFAEVAFQVLIRRPFELIAGLNERNGVKSKYTFNDLQLYIGNYQPILNDEKKEGESLSSMQQIDLQSQMNIDQYDQTELNEYEELVADESDESYCDYGKSSYDFQYQYMDTPVIDPYDINVLTKMPDCPLSSSETQAAILDILHRIEYSHISAISNRRWRELGISKVLSDFSSLLINGANKNDQMSQSRPAFNIDIFKPLWSKFIFILRDRALDETLRENNEMDSLVALIILLRRLATTNESATEQEHNSNSTTSVMLTCFTSLCSSSLLCISARKRSDIAKLVISLFPWMVNNVVGKIDFSDLNSQTLLSQQLPPVCSILEFLAGMDLSLNGNYDKFKSTPEISTQMVSSGLFRELLMLYVGFVESVACIENQPLARRLLRSIFVLCALHPDLYSFASRVPSFRNLLYTQEFVQCHPADAALWALLSYKSTTWTKSNQNTGTLKVLPIIKPGVKNKSLHEVKKLDNDEIWTTSTSIVCSKLCQLLSNRSGENEEHLNVALKDDLIYLVNTISSCSDLTSQLQLISNSSLQSDVARLKQALNQWQPPQNKDNESTRLNKHDRHELSIVIVDSIRKSLKQLSSLLDDQFDHITNTTTNRFQHSSKTD